MARSICALAQSQFATPSASLDPSAVDFDAMPPAATHHSSDASSSPPQSHSPDSLLLYAGDEVLNLDDILLAYCAIEELLTPVSTEEREDIHASRNELGALMRLINEEFQRRIAAAHRAVESVRASLLVSRGSSGSGDGDGNRDGVNADAASAVAELAAAVGVADRGITPRSRP